MRHVIIGTAGHVDHGKTSLIRALTGMETDRLKEEQERGMSIELGFAYFDLPDGSRAGIVDVPGHERFIRQMLSGAYGMDIVLLVVDAKEGVQEQTLEHLEILDLLPGVGEFLGEGPVLLGGLRQKEDRRDEKTGCGGEQRGEPRRNRRAGRSRGEPGGDAIGQGGSGRTARAEGAVEIGVLKAEGLVRGAAGGAPGEVGFQGGAFVVGAFSVQPPADRLQGFFAAHGVLLLDPLMRSRSTARAFVSRALTVAAETPRRRAMSA